MPQPVQSLFWKVRSAPVYLLGGIHLGPQGGFDHGPAVLQIFDTVQKVVFEMSQAEFHKIPVLAQRETGSLLEDLGAELHSWLIADSWYSLGFEQQKLPFVVGGLAVRAYNDIGMTPQFGDEQTLFRRAAARGQRVDGLETAADQIASFSAIPHSTVIAGLVNLLAHPELVIHMRDALISAYRAGNLEGLNEARETMRQLYADVARVLLQDREERWLPQLQDMVLTGQPTLVMVGALHFAGEDGLIRRLEATGLNLDRVER